MSEAKRRPVEAARAALEMALTAGLPGAGERTTVAAVVTAAVRAVVAAVAKRVAAVTSPSASRFCRCCRGTTSKTEAGGSA